MRCYLSVLVVALAAFSTAALQDMIVFQFDGSSSHSPSLCGTRYELIWPNNAQLLHVLIDGDSFGWAKMSSAFDIVRGGLAISRPSSDDDILFVWVDLTQNLGGFSPHSICGDRFSVRGVEPPSPPTTPPPPPPPPPTPPPTPTPTPPPTPTPTPPPTPSPTPPPTTPPTPPTPPPTSSPVPASTTPPPPSVTPAPTTSLFGVFFPNSFNNFTGGAAYVCPGTSVYQSEVSVIFGQELKVSVLLRDGEGLTTPLGACTGFDPSQLSTSGTPLYPGLPSLSMFPASGKLFLKFDPSTFNFFVSPTATCPAQPESAPSPPTATAPTLVLSRDYVSITLIANVPKVFVIYATNTGTSSLTVETTASTGDFPIVLPAALVLLPGQTYPISITVTPYGSFQTDSAQLVIRAVATSQPPIVVPVQMSVATPTVQSVVFTADLTALAVTYSYTPYTAGTIIPCASVVEDISILGVAPRCQFVASNVFFILLGQGTTVFVGTRIYLLAYNHLPAATGLAVGPPQPLTQPTIQLRYPKQWNACEDYVLDASQTSGLGGRSAEFIWSAQTTSGNGDFSDAAARRGTSSSKRRASDIDGVARSTRRSVVVPSTLESFVSAQSGNTVVVPKGILEQLLGRSATFTVTVTNFLGARASFTTSPVLIVTSDIVVPTIDMSPSLTWPKAAPLLARATATLLTCSSTYQEIVDAGVFDYSADTRPSMVEFTWRFSNMLGGIFHGPLGRYPPLFFTQNSNTLIAHAQYGQIESEEDTSVQITATTSPMVAIISGGACTVPYSRPLELSGLRSLDPQNPNIEYQYEWIVSPKLSKAIKQSNPTLRIYGGVLLPGTNYTITLYVHSPSASASTSTVVAVTLNGVAASITLPSAIHSQEVDASKVVLLQAAVLDPLTSVASLSFRWTISGSLSNATVINLSSSSLTLPAGSLSSLSVYTVTLEVWPTAGQPPVAGAASRTFKTMATPMLGSIVVTPSTGVAGQTKFTLQAPGFISPEGTALLYAFSCIVYGSSGDSEEFPLTELSTSAVASNIVLPPSAKGLNITVQVSVYTLLGAKRVRQQSVRVTTVPISNVTAWIDSVNKGYIQPAFTGARFVEVGNALLALVLSIANEVPNVTTTIANMLWKVIIPSISYRRKFSAVTVTTSSTNSARRGGSGPHPCPPPIGQEYEWLKGVNTWELQFLAIANAMLRFNTPLSDSVRRFLFSSGVAGASSVSASVAGKAAKQAGKNVSAFAEAANFLDLSIAATLPELVPSGPPIVWSSTEVTSHCSAVPYSDVATSTLFISSASVKLSPSIGNFLQNVTGTFVGVGLSWWNITFEFGLSGEEEAASKLVSITTFEESGAALPLQGLAEPITVTLPIESGFEGGDYEFSCRFLDRATSLYSTEGCSTVSQNSSHLVCACTHLTDFCAIASRKQNRDLAQAPALFITFSVFFALVAGTSEFQALSLLLSNDQPNGKKRSIAQSLQLPAFYQLAFLALSCTFETALCAIYASGQPSVGTLAVLGQLSFISLFASFTTLAFKWYEIVRYSMTASNKFLSKVRSYFIATNVFVGLLGLIAIILTVADAATSAAGAVIGELVESLVCALFTVTICVCGRKIHGGLQKSPANDKKKEAARKIVFLCVGFSTAFLGQISIRFARIGLFFANSAADAFVITSAFSYTFQLLASVVMMVGFAVTLPDVSTAIVDRSRSLVKRISQRLSQDIQWEPLHQCGVDPNDSPENSKGSTGPVDDDPNAVKLELC